MKYNIIVKPNSKKGPLIIEGEDSLTIYLREKPIEGEANIALIDVLAKHFHVAKSCVIIKSGARGRRKIIEIIGL